MWWCSPITSARGRLGMEDFKLKNLPRLHTVRHCLKNKRRRGGGGRRNNTNMFRKPFFFFFGTGLQCISLNMLCISGWLKTHYLPASTSQVLAWKVCATTAPEVCIYLCGHRDQSSLWGTELGPCAARIALHPWTAPLDPWAPAPCLTSLCFSLQYFF